MPRKRKQPAVAFRRYVDENGEIVEVTRGLGRWWIVARTGHLTAYGDQRKRVKSPRVPRRETPQECQADLDAYAKRRRWKIFEPEGV